MFHVASALLLPFLLKQQQHSEKMESCFFQQLSRQGPPPIGGEFDILIPIEDSISEAIFGASLMEICSKIDQRSRKIDAEGQFLNLLGPDLAQEWF